MDRYELGLFRTNCYVVRASHEAPEAAVVDPGGDAPELRAELERLKTRCAAILITHGHFDHLGGVADLAEASGAPVYMPGGERQQRSCVTVVYRTQGVRISSPDTGHQASVA